MLMQVEIWLLIQKELFLKINFYKIIYAAFSDFIEIIELFVNKFEILVLLIEILSIYNNFSKLILKIFII